jgi:hypothetical protein
MEDTIKSFSAWNGELCNELQMAHEKLHELSHAPTASPPTPLPSPEATIPTKADVIAIPASPHEARAGCLPYADPHVLQVCRSSRKRRNRTESTAPDDVRTCPY